MTILDHPHHARAERREVRSSVAARSVRGPDAGERGVRSTGAGERGVRTTDVGELYTALARRLEQIVRLDVRASDPVIEDACQFAWTRLVYHGDRVEAEKALSWLAKTAVHEAFKLIRREDRELSLDAVVEHAGESTVPACSPGPDVLLEHRQQLDGIRTLPERQQRLLWLHGLGLSYVEMAQYTGCTTRTVERQLLRAKHTLRGAGPA